MYDPFYSDGSVIASWGKLGIRCVNPDVDFYSTSRKQYTDSHFLVSQPPASLLPRLFKEAMRVLHRWALLVPTSFCANPLVHEVGALCVIHITQPVDLRMKEIPVRSKRMSWLIKGVDLPCESLYTRKGDCFWSLGKGDVFSRPSLSNVPGTAPIAIAADVARFGLDVDPRLDVEISGLCSFHRMWKWRARLQLQLPPRCRRRRVRPSVVPVQGL